MSTSKILPYEKLIIFILGLVMLMEFIDVSVLNTSLPQIGYSLRVNPIDLKVALTVYLLALGSFIPAASWVADRFGVRKVLLIAISGFLLSSIACGLSTNLCMLTIARGAQGICGAFISPVARLMVLYLFKARLAEVMAKIVPIFLLGPLLGPLLGGAITTQLNWRFIFFVNVPVGLFSLIMIRCYFADYKSDAPKRFDLIGFLLLAFALGAALFTIDTLTLPTLSIMQKGLFIVMSLALFFAYYRHYRKTTVPIINLAVFLNKQYAYFSFLLVMIMLFCMNMGFIGPLYVQTHYHYSAFASGLLVAPMVIGALISKRTLPLLQARLSLRALLTLLLLISMITLIVLGFSMLYFNVWLFALLLLINGWCAGQLMPIIAQALYQDLGKEIVGTASVVNSAIRQLAQGFAIAMIALILILTSKQPSLNWDTALPNISYAVVMFFSAAMVLIAIGSLYMLMPKQEVVAQQQAQLNAPQATENTKGSSNK